MFNPIIIELVGREQDKDRFREAEQSRLVKVATMSQPANRFTLRAYLGNRSMAIWHTFKLSSILIANSRRSTKR